MSLVIEQLFGEMTVFGFLSLVSFVVTKLPFFEVLDEYIFRGQQDLFEIVETVHMNLFFIMVFYVLQVMVFVRHAIGTEDEYTQMDRIAFLRRTGDDTLSVDEKQLSFEALRQEFILERDPEPPFCPAPKEHRVPDDFLFGRYLSVSLGHHLANAVKLDQWTLVFFVVAIVNYFVIGFLVEGNPSKLAWTWVVIAWIFYAFNLAFERHVIQLKRAFAAREPVTACGEKTSQLLDVEASLPAWCEVNLDKYMRSRSWWNRLLVGGQPNRQQALYWMDRRGPKCYLVILQINLIFTGVYCAMQLMEFVPNMRSEQPNIFLAYVVLAALPVLGNTLNKQELVRNLSQVCSIGVYRRTQAVSAVLLEEKTAQVVRSFVVLHKMRKMSESGGISNAKLLGDSEHTFDRSEATSIGRTFDLVASFRDTIGYDELRQLMSQVNIPTSENMLRNIIETLDEDKDGKISRKEFLKWYAEQAAMDDKTLSDHERAAALFRMFDENDDNEITIGEFKQQVDALNAGLSIDDVAAILNEMDTDNNGTISLHEFETMVKKYYPRELAH